MYPDKSIYFKEPTKGFLNAKKQVRDITLVRRIGFGTWLMYTR